MVACMAFVAMAWWLSLTWDAAQGRVGWLRATGGGLAVLAWGVMAWRWATGLRPQAVRVLHWLPHGALAEEEGATTRAASARWLDEQGRGLEVRVAMDTGGGLLLRLRPTQGQPGRQASAEWRWVGARALQGPWRWRLKTGDRHSPLPDGEKAEQPMVASWTLRASRKATLPKSSRRSA